MGGGGVRGGRGGSEMCVGAAGAGWAGGVVDGEGEWGVVHCAGGVGRGFVAGGVAWVRGGGGGGGRWGEVDGVRRCTRLR